MSEASVSPQYASQDALRALAHPLRLEILQIMRHRDFARAKDLADALGVAANSVSYHLRILARAALIEEAPEHARDKRDRVWRLAGGDLPYVVDGEDQRPDYVEAVGEVGLAAIEWIRAGWIAEVAAGEASASGDMQGRASLQVNTMRMTPEEAMAMKAEVETVFDKYDALHRDESGHDLPDEPGVLAYRVAAAIIASR